VAPPASANVSGRYLDPRRRAAPHPFGGLAKYFRFGCLRERGRHWRLVGPLTAPWSRPGDPLQGAYMMSGIVRAAGRPEAIQQRHDVRLPAIAYFAQYNFDVPTDGIRGCAAFRRYRLNRLAGRQASGDAGLGGGQIKKGSYEVDRRSLRPGHGC
jgi:hypothetical protein